MRIPLYQIKDARVTKSWPTGKGLQLAPFLNIYLVLEDFRIRLKSYDEKYTVGTIRIETVEDKAHTFEVERPGTFVELLEKQIERSKALMHDQI